MPMLDLYHGGESPVVAPSVVSPRAGRPLDFGSGFYTTTSLDQARRWVGIRLRQNAYAKGCVSHYRCDPELLRAQLWGPVANDNVYETLTLFEDGIISKDEAIARQKTYKLVDQILFHSKQALALLEFVDSTDCIS